MRSAAVLLLTGLSALAQMKPASKPAPAATVVGTPTAARVSWQTLSDLEKGFDARLSSAGGADPMVLLGNTRGLCLNGYGAIFTTDAELIGTPRITPFHQQITPAEKADTHKRKIEHLPLLKNAMLEMMRSAAAALKDLPASDQIVVAVRIFYLPWEDTAGLPGQILMKADRQGALAGNIQVEEQ
ncbi:MAG: hypothetical protein LAP87_18530 [Acidobacteriia bacterium]|nr:hypothetical protein [Terriglobia bacterium]